MSYLKDILEKANIENLSDYLLYGEHKVEPKLESYEKRLEKSYEECIEVIKKFDSKGEESELYYPMNAIVTEHMEIGVQA